MSKVYYVLRRKDGTFAVSLSRERDAVVLGMAASLEAAKQLLSDLRTTKKG